MGKQDTEFWWLTGLEATLFLSLPCWELTAPWAEPVSNPLRFGVSLVVGATAAMIACHLGPAAFAGRFGGRQHRFSWIVSLWLGVGYLEWILSSAQAVAASAMSARIGGNPSRPTDWAWFAAAPVFLATVMVAAWVRSWWKPVVAGGLLLGTGILVWALVMNWHGLWARNPHFFGEPPQFDWLIIKGIMLSAAPSVVIGWRIGRIESEPRRIWLSGVAGVWLPLVFSVTMASLAAQAGANLYWVPSRFRGFNWALLGSRGRLEPGVMTLTSWTLWWPALLSAVSLRALVPQWTRRQKVWLVPIVVCLLICAVASTTWHPEGFYSVAATPAHQLWAKSLVILGATAGIACLVLRHSR